MALSSNLLNIVTFIYPKLLKIRRNVPKTFDSLTVNLHFLQPCNYQCKYCFARFSHFTKTLSLSECELILLLLKMAGTRRVNFAGGEPFISPNLGKMIHFAKNVGLKTSIVTNGSLISYEWLKRWGGSLDILAISIDSIKKDTLRKLGRAQKNKVLEWQSLFALLAKYNKTRSKGINH